jgi:hypothetical protein
MEPAAETTHPGSDNIVTFPGYSVFRRKDSILQVDFMAGFAITLDDARQQVELLKQLKTSEKCLLLAIFREGNIFDKDVREFISSEEVTSIVKADALVIKGLALKILANGYLQINRPNRPCRVFNNTTNALAWLHQYL